MGKEVLTWERERETWKIRKATWEGWEKLSWERGKATLGIGYWSELKKKKKSKWSVVNKRKGTHWGDQQQDCLLERVNNKNINTVLTYGRKRHTRNIGDLRQTRESSRPLTERIFAKSYISII